MRTFCRDGWASAGAPTALHARDKGDRRGLFLGDTLETLYFGESLVMEVPPRTVRGPRVARATSIPGTALVLCMLFLSISFACDPRRYCPTNCTVKGGIENDGITLLDPHLDLVLNVGKAVDIMRQYPGVLTDDRLFVHTTMQVGVGEGSLQRLLLSAYLLLKHGKHWQANCQPSDSYPRM
jgi:hypothetical protein